MRTWFHLALAVALLVVHTGCLWPFKRKSTTVSSPSPTQQRSSARTKASGPAKKAKTSKQVRQSKPPAQAKPASPVAKPAAPDSAAATLSQVLTAEERRELGESVQSRLAAARKDLASIADATLTPDQAETLRTVRSFILRAENVKNSDPLLASQLAYRAKVLAGSLALSVR